mmetsp:Transcript_35212/g.79447  ORF Transcript_35212/g.79447 Transcript_35212/m.79447 type:complete len:387 (-) Transcript_35212:85-1245(-)
MPKKKVDKTMAAQDPAADQDPNAPKNPEAKSKPKGCVGAVSQILWKVVRGKKNKVKPEDEAKKTMSAEEIKAKEAKRKLKEAQAHLKEDHMRKLCRVYHVKDGLLPEPLCRNLPKALRAVSPLLFGRPSPPIKGPAAAIIRLLGLGPWHVRRMKIVFNAIDVDSSKTLSLNELIEYIDGEDTKFFQELLKVTMFRSKFKLMNDPTMDFGEFVCSCSNLCTFTDDQILHRIFTIFDEDGSGIIEKREAGKLAEAIQSMSGAGAFSGNAAVFLQDLDKNADGLLTFDEFMGMHEAYPMVFWPAMKCQDILRKKTADVDFWKRSINAWNEKEMERAKTLERPPQNLSAQMEMINLWYDQQRADSMRSKARQANKKAAASKIAGGKRKKR